MSILDCDSVFYDLERDKKIVEEWIKDNYTITGKLTISDDLTVDCSGNVAVNNKYIEYLKNIGLNVDDKTLIKSRRCSKEVCEFIKKKLGIEIKSNEINNGRIIALDDPSEITNIIEDDDIVKLVWNSTENYKFNAVTWGYSKGDTYENVCVILTDKYSNLNEESFIRNESISSTNKLYVALTRSKGNVYLIKKSQLNENS